MACMLSGRMPINCAAVESSATASIFDPSEVRVSRRCRPSVTSNATPPANSREAWMRKPNTSKVPPTMFSGNVRKLAPNHQNAEQKAADNHLDNDSGHAGDEPEGKILRGLQRDECLEGGTAAPPLEYLTSLCKA